MRNTIIVSKTSTKQSKMKMLLVQIKIHVSTTTQLDGLEAMHQKLMVDFGDPLQLKIQPIEILNPNMRQLKLEKAKIRPTAKGN